MAWPSAGTYALLPTTRLNSDANPGQQSPLQDAAPSRVPDRRLSGDWDGLPSAGLGGASRVAASPRQPPPDDALAAIVERSNGQILVGPPRSRAGARAVGIPRAIRPVLREHLSLFVGPAPGALAFPGAKGGPLRRGNFNKLSGWPHAVQAIGAEVCTFVISASQETRSRRPAASNSSAHDRGDLPVL